MDIQTFQECFMLRKSKFLCIKHSNQLFELTVAEKNIMGHHFGDLG